MQYSIVLSMAVLSAAAPWNIPFVDHWKSKHTPSSVNQVPTPVQTPVIKTEYVTIEVPAPDSHAQPSTTPSGAVPTSAPSPSQGADPSTSWAQQLLDLHNIDRNLSGTPNVTWSNELEAAAQEAANRGKFEHTTEAANTLNAGENIYWTSTGSAAPSDIMKAWYNDEKAIYNPANPSAHETGHFTQVVWKATTMIGCAFGPSSTGGTLAFCKYSPRGNVQGQYAENVPF